MVSRFNHKRPFREKSCKRPACERSWLAAVQGCDHLSHSPAFTTTTPVLPGWSAVRKRSSLFENKQNCFLFFHQHYIWLSGWSPTRISSQIPLRVQPEKQSDNLLDQSSDHLTHPMILLLFNNNNLCGVCYAPPTPPRQLSGKQGDHCCCKVISVTV